MIILIIIFYRTMKNWQWIRINLKEMIPLRNSTVSVIFGERYIGYNNKKNFFSISRFFLFFLCYRSTNRVNYDQSSLFFFFLFFCCCLLYCTYFSFVCLFLFLYHIIHCVVSCFLCFCSCMNMKKKKKKRKVLLS